MVQRDDDTHVWGECLKCGRIAGKISREAIRRYIEAERRDDAFIHQQSGKT